MTVMRSLLARFGLLALLLMLLVQGSGGGVASTGQLVDANGSYLPGSAPGTEQQRVDENATVESDSDDSSDDSCGDGDVGTEVTELHCALSTPVVGTWLLWRSRYRFIDSSLNQLLFRRVALPLRGPPCAGPLQRWERT